MLIGEVVHALQFNNQLILDDEISHVFTHGLSFVANPKRDLRFDADPVQRKFTNQGAFIDPLQEPGTQHVGDFERAANYLFSQFRFE